MVFNPANGNYMAPPVTSATLSADGSRAIVAYSDGTVRSWYTLSGQLDASWRVPQTYGQALVASTDGFRVYVGGVKTNATANYGYVMGHDLLTCRNRNGNICNSIYQCDMRNCTANTRTQALLYNTSTAPVPDGSINSLAISIDSKVVLSLATDKMLRLWNATAVARNQIAAFAVGNRSNLNEPPAVAARFTAFGAIYVVYMNGLVRLLDPTTGNTAYSFILPSTTVYAMTLIKTSNLAFACADGTVKVANITGQVVHTLSGHSASVTAVAASNDGSVLASGDENGEIMLWNVSTGKRITTLRPGHFGAISSLVFNFDGSRLLSGSSDGVSSLWNTKQ